MDTTPRVVECQVDWLTCSASKGDKADQLRDRAERWATEEVADGNRTKPFAFYGYQGVKAGRVRLGVSDRGTLLQLSGDPADRHLQEALSLSDRVTRIDVALTAQYPTERTDVATIALCDYIQYWNAHGRPADWQFHTSGRGGETFYIGDRTSEKFARIYDKSAESREARYARCWRWELELKGTISAPVAASLAASAARSGEVRSGLHSFFTQHGIRLPWPSESDDVYWRGFRRRADSEVTLSWLRDRVSPALRHLRSAGYADDALAALGLVEPPAPDPSTLPPLTHAPSAQRTP